MRETKNLEFKRELTKSYLKTVSAFANYGTGRIVFGVDDAGGAVGLNDPRDVALRIENAVNDSLNPVPRFELSVDDSACTVTLTVHEGLAKPYLCGGKAYRRADSSTVEVDGIEFGRLVLVGANTTFDALESSLQDLSFERLGEELMEKVGLRAVDENALISLELMSPSGTYNNAAALLADENQFVGTDIARFGDNINIILSRHPLEGISLLEQMERSLAVFDEHYAYEEVVGMRRVPRSLVPREAFREALANALVHRCWDVRASVQVSMFRDRIEVTSPGGLPEGMTEEQYLRRGVSVARNPILANVFFRLGYIERFGTGIPRIVEAYADSEVSPRFSIGVSSITVTLPVTGGVKLSQDEEAMLAVLPKGIVLGRREIEAAAGMSKDKSIRVLNGLVEKGIVRRAGSGRAVRYARS